MSNLPRTHLHSCYHFSNHMFCPNRVKLHRWLMFVDFALILFTVETKDLCYDNISFTCTYPFNSSTCFLRFTWVVVNILKYSHISLFRSSNTLGNVPVSSCSHRSPSNCLPPLVEGCCLGRQHSCHLLTLNNPDRLAREAFESIPLTAKVGSIQTISQKCS